MENNSPCRGGLHDFTPIIEGNETVGLVCLIDGCGFTVREDMSRSHISVSPDTKLSISEVMSGGNSHCGQKGGRL
jgi:hypothetical protein